MIGVERTVSAVMKEVLLDCAYYRKSGGGLTLSGGEPMAQLGFTLALLKAARAKGIHTCLETSGQSGRYAEVLPWVDLFLFDYKATSSDEHKRLTGAANHTIVSNLEKLCGAGASILLRCPLVPGVNDQEEHLQGIASLSLKYPNLIGVEIMAYHNLGVSKGERIGRPSQLPPIDPPTKEIQDGWISRLHELGCTKARLG